MRSMVRDFGSSFWLYYQWKGVSKQNLVLLEGKEVADKTRCLDIVVNKIILQVHSDLDK